MKNNDVVIIFDLLVIVFHLNDGSLLVRYKYIKRLFLEGKNYGVHRNSGGDNKIEVLNLSCPLCNNKFRGALYQTFAEFGFFNFLKQNHMIHFEFTATSAQFCLILLIFVVDGNNSS